MQPTVRFIDVDHSEHHISGSNKSQARNRQIRDTNTRYYQRFFAFKPDSAENKCGPGEEVNKVM